MDPLAAEWDTDSDEDDDELNFNGEDEDAPAADMELPTLGRPVTYSYDGVDISFPREAYESQQLLMKKIITGLREGANCLLESPTGTGKTLALLCPTIAWVQKCKQEGPDYWRIPAIEDRPCQCDFDVHEDCRIIQDISAITWDQPYPSLVRIRNVVPAPEGRGQNGEPEAPVEGAASAVGAGEIMETRYVDKICVRCRLKYYKLNTPPKIYYVTRTVSQSMGNVKQLMGTHYRESIRMTILASREKTCEEEDILQRRQQSLDGGHGHPAVSIDDECSVRRTNHYYNQKQRIGAEFGGRTPRFRSPTCSFFHGMQEMAPVFMAWQLDHPVWDIEDLKRDAIGSFHMCPYYGARAMLPEAEIVFCTYNYLIWKHVRGASKIDLINNVVIFDEAHNIESTCRAAASKTVAFGSLLYAVAKLDASAQAHAAMAAPSPHDHTYNRLVLDLAIALRQLQAWILREGAEIELLGADTSKEKVFTTQELRTAMEGADLRQGDWVGVGDMQQQLATLEGGGAQGNVAIAPDIKVERRVHQFVKQIVEVFGFVFEADAESSDFVTCLEKTRTRRQQQPSTSTSAGIQAVGGPKRARLVENFDYKLKIICLNPALAFDYIRRVARTIIVASGTLTPMDALEAELDTPFPLKVSAPHVVPRSNVWVGIIHKSTSPKKPNLMLVKTQQGNRDTQDEIGAIILKVCRIVPFGVLVLVPSYGFLDDLRARWSNSPGDTGDSPSTPVLEELQGLKRVFYESQNDSEYRRDIEAYKRAAVCGNGAILFGVFRGKVSEGVDFADDQARGLVSLGIPLLPFGAPEVAYKRKYNDVKARNHSQQQADVVPPLTALTGQQWYDAQGYRSLNQGFGRIIRHEQDWGAIFIIEKRFEHAHAPARSHLPSWVKESARIFDSVERSMADLQEFVEEKMHDRVPTQPPS